MHVEHESTNTRYAKALGLRLRAIRNQQGLSLQGVEEKSSGRWKAVVVGSYERGDRAVTVSRLAEIADFYRVPITELLPEAGARNHVDGAGKVVLDLDKLYTSSMDGNPEVQCVGRFARSIQQMRGDYNGRVLSIRTEDLRAMAIAYDKTPAGLVDMLDREGLLVKDLASKFVA